MADVNDRSRISVSPFGDPIHVSTAEFRAVTYEPTMPDDDIIMIDPLTTADTSPMQEAGHTFRPTENMEVVIDLTCDDETDQAIEELTSDMAHVAASSITPTGDDSASGRSSGNSSVISNQSASSSATPERTQQEINIGGIVFKAGISLELDDGSFMRVEDVIPQPHDLRFFGRRLYRTTHPEAKTYLPKLNHELVWLTQNTDHVSIKRVRRVVPICFTNFRTDFNTPGGELTCRLKLTIRQSGVVILPGHAPLSAEQCAIEWLTFSESDPGYGKPANLLRREWRDQTVPFGEASASSLAMDLERQGVIDLTTPDRAYTFGDAYCGAGGVSCGAKQAGVKLQWAVDIDKHALETYQLNFNDVEVEHSDFFSFLTNDPKFLRVDIAHCSPPCQTWSPAHTVPCPRDDANSACVFSAGSLIRESRPRVLTMEETMGLPQRFPVIFNRVVLDMVEFGYSVRWSVLGCDEYGVPQERKRLLLIAAGPGEALPHYAQPTHGMPGHGLLPRATISSTIDNIPPDADDHNVDGALARWALSYRPSFDRNSLARTITCGGGEYNYHPSGTRPYTNREMALLQTFPLDFQFTGRFMRKQIGNAVPPLFAKAIYGEIVKSLRQTDTEEAMGNFH
ncbi:C-5 cytosine methyltransferase [Penicillium coprophilum]|uniref:C-5 cytosine methyltransferase n=1 Tax=Penicillium coprophilum TaxID=36646 RepID=UPI00239760BA|nr:C-5 cytosine methyltransferase [Penicillium coprophilum]KAJ5173719.1 C-5 cytosine methyltransferase [Penicillium coprophilum]